MSISYRDACRHNTKKQQWRNKQHPLTMEVATMAHRTTPPQDVEGPVAFQLLFYSRVKCGGNNGEEKEEGGDDLLLSHCQLIPSW